MSLSSILMPALSPTMTEGNLVKWLKKEGDSISSGDVIAEIETDKATMEVEAVDDGKIVKILVPEGTESVKVNSPIAVLLEDGENASAKEIEDFIKNLSTEKTDNTKEIAETKEKKPARPTTTAPAPASVSAPAPAPASVSVSSPTKAPATSPVINTPTNNTDRILATPVARKIAQDRGIPLPLIKGTGPNGRITKSDVESFDVTKIAQSANSNAGATKKTSKTKNLGPAIRHESLLSSQGKEIHGSADSGFTPDYVEESLSSIRKVIAARLAESKQTVPHFYLTVKICLDKLIELRSDLNDRFAADGIRISVNDFIVKACSLALQDVPDANASWFGDSIRKYINSDISIAVAVDDGLITPIVRAAESKSLMDISTEIKSLVKKAKAGELKPVEFQGGTFSISNLGMFGISEFSAVINPPQGAILAVGTAEEELFMDKANGGEIKNRTVMKVTLSCDHRVIDGAVAAKFLNQIKDYLENPISLVI